MAEIGAGPGLIGILDTVSGPLASNAPPFELKAASLTLLPFARRDPMLNLEISARQDC